jgi:hypothetical protein
MKMWVTEKEPQRAQGVPLADVVQVLSAINIDGLE